MIRYLLGRLALSLMKLGRRYEEERILNACGATRRQVVIRMPIAVHNPEKLSLGESVHIGEYVHLRARGGLRIGNRVAIAAHAVITTQGHPVDLPRFSGKRAIVTEEPVIIQDDVWIGSGAIILPGVTVGRGAVVAAGAVVVSDVPEMMVVAGVPARVIRSVATVDRSHQAGMES